MASGFLRASPRHTELTIDHQGVNITARTTQAVTIGHSLPAPTLRWREGDVVDIKVKNNLDVMSAIHWHGIILPSDMDGVPGLSFPGIPPGGSYRYRFKLKQAGTYWYHSHSGFQEQQGVYGAIVVDPAETEPFPSDREHAIVLSDWSDENPQTIFATLKKNAHVYNRSRRTLAQLMSEVRQNGIAGTYRERQMWNRMRMLQTDLADVSGYTYTYLMNGVAPQTGWFGEFARGETVRLRFINAAAMSIFDIRIPGVTMKVIAADGQDIEPVTVDEFRIAPAQTFDVLVRPEVDACTVFAQSVDRSGFARGTLSIAPGLVAEVPGKDPVPLLTHADMGMSMEILRPAQSHTHAHHHMKSEPLVHAKTEYGPGIDMRAESVSYRLDDPGVGLRDNGRRVLTYADLRRLKPSMSMREPEREIELHLTGNMNRYMWSFNGVSYKDAEPIHLTFGERVRFTLVNDTMMTHPIHLHGMWSELETGDDNHLPALHTVSVQPGSKVSYRVTADARGRWAYHCHLLYHMMGMFREVRVS